MTHRRWWQIGALGGIAFVVLQIVSQALMQVGGAEPEFNASAARILQFFQDRDPQLYGVGDYLSTLSLIPYIWFLGTLWATLRRAGENYGWLAMAAVALGAISMVVLAFGSSWTLGVARLDEGLSEEQARLLFDQANFAFANAFVTIGGMLLAVGVISLQTGVLPRWNGWLAVIAAVGLLIGRAFWATSQAVFIPYILYWVWLIATSITLFRQPAASHSKLQKPEPRDMVGP